MSDIRLHRNHQLPLADLKQKIEQMIVELEDKLEFKTEWVSAGNLSFRRKGANGNIEIDESNFVLTIKLGMMYRMLKSVIHNEIVSVVDQKLK